MGCGARNESGGVTGRRYRIHVAAELAGMSEGLLRAWERRYGVPKPDRTASGYRTYSEQDIALLRRLRALVEGGMAVGDAVQLVPELERELALPPPVAAGGASRVEGWLEEVLSAAAQCDQARVELVLDEALSALPPLTAYDKLLAPLQREVGERWHQGTMSVAEEHLVTHSVRARLLSLIHGAPKSARKHVVCACFPREDHDVGLLGAALRFRHAGFRVTYLGARTPPDQLHQVVGALKPELVALAAVNDEGKKAFRQDLRALVSHTDRSRTEWVAGGAACQRYADVCEQLQVVCVRDDEHWASLLH